MGKGLCFGAAEKRDAQRHGSLLSACFSWQYLRLGPRGLKAKLFWCRSSALTQINET